MSKKQELLRVLGVYLDNAEPNLVYEAAEGLKLLDTELIGRKIVEKLSKLPEDKLRQALSIMGLDNLANQADEGY